MFEPEPLTFEVHTEDPLEPLPPADHPAPLAPPLEDLLNPDPDYRPSNRLNQELQLRFDATDTEHIAAARVAAACTHACGLEPRVFCGEAHDAADPDDNPTPNPLLARPAPIADWRFKQNKVHRTGQGVLALCLNIGTDPPDVVRVPPCAHELCWMDPISVPPLKCLEKLGRGLQHNYELWRDRVKYRPVVDPTRDELKSLCEAARQKATENGNERVLFHYNGYGVPRPTLNGELWVFNPSYTQYMPLALFDLHSWLGDPAVYVFDCPAAGRLLPVLRPYQSKPAAKLRPQDTLPGAPLPADIPDPLRNVIMLFACQEDEDLPTTPDLPADAFTAALTTPVKLALHVHAAQRPLDNRAWYRERIAALLAQGGNQERNSPVGELVWVLTTITDTIAYNLIPQPLFQKLFRGDLLLAALFRHFLLAQRLLLRYGIRPFTYPLLPCCAAHPLWAEWDRVLDGVLQQLPSLQLPLEGEPRPAASLKGWHLSDHFERQLDELRHWIGQPPEDPAAHPAPLLPMLVQVFLSTRYRINALVLFARYVDMGRWAVQQGLMVGAQLYTQKLLGTTTRDMFAPLLLCWAKMLAADPSLQDDLVLHSLKSAAPRRANQAPLPPPAHSFFLRQLSDDTQARDHRSLAAFCLASICAHNPSGQDLCFRGVNGPEGLLHACHRLLEAAPLTTPEPGRELGAWVMHVRCLCLCLGRLLEDQPEYAMELTSLSGIQLLQGFLHHPLPAVRTAAVFALGCMICSSFPGTEEAREKQEGLAEWLKRHNVGVRAPAEVERFVAVQLLDLATDAAVLVRAELAAALARLVCGHMPAFLRAVARRQRAGQPQPQPRGGAAGAGGAAAAGGSDAAQASTASSATAQRGAQGREEQWEEDEEEEGGEGEDDEEEEGGEEAGPTLQGVAAADDPATHPFYDNVVEVLVRLATDSAPVVACLGRKALAVAGCSVTDPFSGPRPAPPCPPTEPPSPRPHPPHYTLHPSFHGAGSASSSTSSTGSTSSAHHQQHHQHPLNALTSKIKSTVSWVPGLASAAASSSSAATSPLRSASPTPPHSPAPAPPPPTVRGPFPLTYNPPAGHHAAHCSPYPHLYPNPPDPDLLAPRPDDFPDPPFPLAVTAAISRPLLRPTTSRWRDLHAPLWTRAPDPGRADARYVARRDGRLRAAAMATARVREPLSIPLPPAPTPPPTSTSAPHHHRTSAAASAAAPSYHHHHHPQHPTGPPTALSFHTYHPLLLAADPSGLIHIHDYSHASRSASATSSTPAPPPHARSCFHVATGTPYAPPSDAPHPPVVALYQANEVFTPLPAATLLACTADGVVRVWRNYPAAAAAPPRTHPPRPLQLVTTWQAVPLAAYPHAPPTRAAAFAWSPLEPRLYAAGGAAPAIIHCWDAQEERCTDHLERRPPPGDPHADPAPVERLAGCADPPLLLSTEADGMVRVYDVRAADPEVFSYHHAAHTRAPQHRLCGALLRPCAQPHAVVLGTRGGELTLLDMRAAGGPAAQSVTAHAAGAMRHLAAHSHAPILATATADGTVKVWNGRALADKPCRVKPRDQPDAPVGALAFHPTEPFLAVADATPGLTVYVHEDAGPRAAAAAGATTSSASAAAAGPSAAATAP